jgi:hypothetical protein
MGQSWYKVTLSRVKYLLSCYCPPQKGLQYGLRPFPGLGGWRQDDLGQAGQGRITVTGKEMRVLRLFCRKYVNISFPGPDVTYEPGRNGFNGYIQLVLRSKSGRLVINCLSDNFYGSLLI